MSKISTFSRSQVSEQNSRDSLWIINDNKVYDISKFIDTHPGGADWLLKFGGQDVTFVMKDKDLHSHSDHSYSLLADFYIGDIVDGEKWINQQADSHSPSIKIAAPSANFIDPNKPIFTQMWNSNFTNDFYLEQVHIPR
ncbi:Ceramide very long chain fatty acid hydroxylase SCS7, partial [Smittium mucronatum]